MERARTMQTFKDYVAEEAAIDKELEEVATIQQRMKMKAAMRRNKAKIKLGKRKAERKVADKERLQKRAQRQARKAVLAKILKGKDKSELSYGARASFEKQLNKRGALIKRLARKLLPTVRKADRAKFSNKGEK
jgi:hypothetical protein